MNRKIPDGLKLRYRLEGHRGVITRMAWSPDGKLLASPSRDGTIQIWDALNGQHVKAIEGFSGRSTVWHSSVAWSPDGALLAAASSELTVWICDLETGHARWGLDGHVGAVNCVAWSADGSRIATGSDDRTVRLWDAETTELMYTLPQHAGRVLHVAWSPDGQTLASCATDATIRLWGSRVGLLQQSLQGHADVVTYLAWSPDNKLLASASLDNTIRIWDAASGRNLHILEGHADYVVSASFSHDGQLLASKSHDGTVRLWRCDNWKAITQLEEDAFLDSMSCAIFHPHNNTLATLDETDTMIRLWDVDLPFLLGGAPLADTIHYTNAKVVLVGDTGVGKSGLGLVLTGQSFIPTESTHGRHVWTMVNEKLELPDGQEETHEILLWDLAGQPGYRLIHQLHLNEVAVALVVFDSRSDADLFAGVRHWNRALRQVQRLQGESGIPMHKLLVAARTDRGSIGVSQARIDNLLREMGFEAYFETSAKEGWEIAQLSKAIRQAIDWQAIPKVSSTALFQHIKDFLMATKSAGRLLATADDLYQFFRQQTRQSQLRLPEFALADEGADTLLRVQFDTCVGRVESRGLIRRLSFGNLVLLQPELLDAYASAIVNAARGEPEGLGSIAEEDARQRRFPISADERIQDMEQEKLLLLATVEDLIRHEIALREETAGGPMLVFPSEFTREQPYDVEPEGKAVMFDFEGPILNIYATLTVRLARSGVFAKEALYKNAATFTVGGGKRCGIILREQEEGHGELTLFFTPGLEQTTRQQFEEYVGVHLQRTALPETVTRRRVIACPACNFVVTEQLMRLRLERGHDWVLCPVCTTQIQLKSEVEKVKDDYQMVITRMDRSADQRREMELADAIFQGKIATGDFDVLLCYHDVDQKTVRTIARKLRERGILPWPYDWERPQTDIPVFQIKAVAFFVGARGTGPGSGRHLAAFWQEVGDNGCVIIPNLVQGAPVEPKPPAQFTNLPWIDFRQIAPDPIELLTKAITGGRNRTSHRQNSVWVVGGTAATGHTPKVVDLQSLGDTITRRFTLLELQRLASDLRIRIQDLQSGLGTPLGQELVAYCDRRGHIPDLIQQCRRLRPDFPW